MGLVPIAPFFSKNLAPTQLPAILKIPAVSPKVKTTVSLIQKTVKAAKFVVRFTALAKPLAFFKVKLAKVQKPIKSAYNVKKDLPFHKNGIMHLFEGSCRFHQKDQICDAA